jgi:hypothetical protein
MHEQPGDHPGASAHSERAPEHITAYVQIVRTTGTTLVPPLRINGTNAIARYALAIAHDDPTVTAVYVMHDPLPNPDDPYRAGFVLKPRSKELQALN